MKRDEGVLAALASGLNVRAIEAILKEYTTIKLSKVVAKKGVNFNYVDEEVH